MIDSQIDYVGIAEILLRNLKNVHPSYVIAHPGEDALEIAELLKNGIDPELITELIATDIGQGILIGIVTKVYFFMDEHELDFDSDDPFGL